jgi:hypothetical protein
MHQQLWGYKVEEKIYLAVCEQIKVEYHCFKAQLNLTEITKINKMTHNHEPTHPG